VAYSNDPAPNPYAGIPSPIPNIDFPVPFWINKLTKLLIIGCLNPDIAIAGLAIASGLKALYTVASPATKEIIKEGTGSSWLCGSQRVIQEADYGEEIAHSSTGRFTYGLLAGLDIAAYHAFMMSTGAQGVFDFLSALAKFERNCKGDQSPYRGLTAVGGWPTPGLDWNTGPSWLNGSGGNIGPALFLHPYQRAAIYASCSFSNLGGDGGIVASMRIADVTTGMAFDSDTVNNIFNTEDRAIVATVIEPGYFQETRQISVQVHFDVWSGGQAVAVDGDCYIRAWDPETENGPPLFNMATDLEQKHF
jgi:hypothetical protein